MEETPPELVTHRKSARLNKNSQASLLPPPKVLPRSKLSRPKATEPTANVTAPPPSRHLPCQRHPNQICHRLAPPSPQQMCPCRNQLPSRQLMKSTATFMSDPAKSTATSAEEETQTFTKSQVAVLIGSKIATERRAFAKELAAQAECHRAEFDEIKKTTEYNATCLAALYKLSGAPMPAPNEGSSKGNDGGGADTGEENGQNSSEDA